MFGAISLNTTESWIRFSDIVNWSAVISLSCWSRVRAIFYFWWNIFTWNIKVIDNLFISTWFAWAIEINSSTIFLDSTMSGIRLSDILDIWAILIGDYFGALMGLRGNRAHAVRELLGIGCQNSQAYN